ncbi:MAG: NUDIX hydrolase [Actinomycetota bacterium]|nr:NUDIX hydrolase [Actinomycetota bacterium]
MQMIETLLIRSDVSATDSVVERALELARSPGSADRDRFVPGHFTASGFVVSPDGSSLLLISHRRLGRWLQPGGHIDPEDTSPIAAAAREVTEETGVTVEPILADLIDLDIHQIPPRAPEPAHEHFDLRFAFRALDETLVASDEVFAAIWVPWENLNALAVGASVTRGAGILRRACS